MNIDTIIQWRFHSRRLPGKILLPLDKNQTSLDILIKNLKLIKEIDRIILAVPNDDYSSTFKKISKRHNIHIYAPKCKTENVLKRFYLTSKKFNSKNIIRITSDCPFINIHMVRKMINFYKKNDINFLTNNKPRRVPHGFDCEIFSIKLLKKTYLNAKSSFDKEHVTQWIYKNYFTNKNNIILLKKNSSNIRITLDTFNDYIKFIKNINILKKISKSKDFIKFLKLLK